MAKITWDGDGERRYETGCDHGVLYPKQTTAKYYTKADLGSLDAELPSVTDTTKRGTRFYGGVAWNGLVSVSENPSGADANDLWADNIKYASLRAAESFGATIEAYMYPDEFLPCDGCQMVGGVIVSQQARLPFGFSFRSDIGIDADAAVDKNDKYKIHIIYNATASPSSKQFSTINESPDAITFSYEITTTPISAGSNYKPVSILTVDSTKANSAKLAILEKALYGYDTNGNNTNANDEYKYLPMPEDILALFAE